MKIKVWLDKKFKEPEILICTQEITAEVQELKEKITEAISLSITAYSEDGAELLSCSDITRVFAQDEHVFAQCEGSTFMLRKKLYELETILPQDEFVRISRSEFVNIRKIKRLDTSLTGTIKMTLSSDVETYVSRRNVAKIKAKLGL